MVQPGRISRKGKTARKRFARKRDIAIPVSSRAFAFSVHIFTASGAACAIMALLAATRADWVAMFAWLGLALVIDGVDGALARYFRVADTLPRWSGDTLDLVVDFTTYVFVPAYALAVSGLLPDPVAIALSIAIVVSAAIYCADREMKLPDNSFRGFPILWNGVAFHLFVLKLPPWATAAIVVALIILTFAPYRTIHPMRIPYMRVANALGLLVWLGLALYALLCRLDPGFWPALALNVLGVYLLWGGLFLPMRPADLER